MSKTCCAGSRMEPRRGAGSANVRLARAERSLATGECPTGAGGTFAGTGECPPGASGTFAGTGERERTVMPHSLRTPLPTDNARPPQERAQTGPPPCSCLRLSRRYHDNKPPARSTPDPKATAVRRRRRDKHRPPPGVSRPLPPKRARPDQEEGSPGTLRIPSSLAPRLPAKPFRRSLKDTSPALPADLPDSKTLPAPAPRPVRGASCALPILSMPPLPQQDSRTPGSDNCLIKHPYSIFFSFVLPVDRDLVLAPPRPDSGNATSVQTHTTLPRLSAARSDQITKDPLPVPAHRSAHLENLNTEGFPPSGDHLIHVFFRISSPVILRIIHSIYHIVVPVHASYTPADPRLCPAVWVRNNSWSLQHR